MDEVALHRLEMRVQRIFLERMQFDVHSVEEDLFDSGVVDSLSFVELLVHLEEEFGTRIEIEELDLDDFRTISKIARVLSPNGNRP
ncbi:MAG: phosphopantetheine-binding protein [Thermoanaerobaculia bacterium]